MDIPLVTTAPLRAPIAIAPVSATQVLATAQTQAAALLAETTVDLSPLGRFLSAVTLFQKRILELQANPAAVAAEADSDEALAAVASSAVALSESANALQASLINGTSDDQSLATLFNQQFNAQTSGDGDSDSLAAIGLAFTAGQGGDDVLDVDTAVLRAAFLADPQGTAALLGRTATAFGALTGVAAEAGADPSALFADEANEAADAPATGVTAPAQAGTQGLPEFADAPAPISSDGAFLQELLAETPRPALALSQAPPPAVAEANATFAAERAAQAVDAGPGRPQDNAAPLPPPLADTALDAAAASAAATAPRTSAAPDLPPTASQAAVNATSGVGTPRPAIVDADTRSVSQMADQRGNALRIEARDANNRIVDIIAAERDANERIAGAIAADRAAQASVLETQDIDTAAVMRAGDKATEQRRLDEADAQNSVDRTVEARQMATEEGPPERAATTLARPMAPADGHQDDVIQPVVQPAAQRPQPLPVNNAQQLARDPAIAAAIAAYNLNAGPFAALNGRPEIAAQRPKLVPAVDGVSSVEAIETDAATSDSSRPFR